MKFGGVKWNSAQLSSDCKDLKYASKLNRAQNSSFLKMELKVAELLGIKRFKKEKKEKQIPMRPHATVQLFQSL